MCELLGAMPVKFTEIPEGGSSFSGDTFVNVTRVVRLLDAFDDVHVLLVGMSTVFIGFLLVYFSVGYARH